MNFYDYLAWRGDLTFDRDPFNEVDNLLFSYAAYVDLREVITDGQEMTIRDAAEEFFKTHTEEECLKSGSLIAHAPVIMRRMGETKRFGDLLITDYVRDIDEEASQQFSAMHFVIDRKTSYVAYCGTDDTIIGWKEDFQLSYKTVSAQIKAAEYLNRTAKKMLRNYIIGGHSKGGNLAVYAAMKANKPVKKKILHVYSNDGPGISDISIDRTRFDLIQPKITKIIPELSVFGLLFDNKEDRIVISSDKSGLYEHDPVGWEVKGTQFVRGTLNDDSIVIQDVLNDFLNVLSLKEREELVDQMYGAFVKAGIVNTTDFTKKGLPIIFKFLKEVTSLNENAGRSMEKLLQIIGKAISEKTEDTIKHTVKNVSESIPDFIKPNKRKKKEETTE